MIKHEFTIHWKSKKKKMNKGIIKDSESAFKYFVEFFDKNTIELHETAYMLVLNTASEILGIHKISDGGMTGTIIDARKVILSTILLNGKCVILAHNHPSGRLEFSQPDIEVTKRIKQALKHCELELLDHLIITNEGYKSIADEGLI